ncbi:regulatory particle non-ATPase [Rhodotorula toruloides]
MSNQEATRLYGQLTSEWANGAADQVKIRSLLAQLKIELSELGLLFPDAKTHEAGALTTAREVLEIGALFSIRTDDIPAFERYLSLLSAYYSDLSSFLPGSRLEPSILALSLLRLLSQNRIAEFHTLVETLAEDEGRKKDVLESKEVGWVMQLERCLMEGSYSRVWSLCSSSSSHSSLPVPEFAHFTSTLLSTVRSEIAACDERAYESLPLRDAKTLLFFHKEAEVKEFAKQRNWHLDPSTSLLHFPSSPQHPSNRTALGNVPSTLATGADSRELDRSRVVEATLRYTKELETIV